MSDPVPAARSARSADPSDAEPAAHPGAPARSPAEAELKALIVDWGGVLTTPLADALDDWFEAEGISASAYTAAMSDFHDRALSELSLFDPIGALERGELAVQSFEEQLAAGLSRHSGTAVAATGLVGRMFAGFAAAPAMVNVVRRARAAGLRTALLSNSWGNDYLRDDWDALFDVVVISGEVGMRKPDAEIYRYTLAELGCRPAEAVFVDDMETNVRGAAAVGIVGVHHNSYERTVQELEALFGVPLG